MKRPSIKLNRSKIAKILLNIGFVALIAYEGFFIHGLYKTLHSDPAFEVVKRVVRVDFKLMDQAVARYKAAREFNIPAVVGSDGKPLTSMPDPFANNVPIPAGR
jgi:hypothetical protein